jgi:hypothetical protein
LKFKLTYFHSKELRAVPTGAAVTVTGGARSGVGKMFGFIQRAAEAAYDSTKAVAETVYETAEEIAQPVADVVVDVLRTPADLLDDDE